MGLDVVEILMGWEEAFGVEISDEEAFKLRTPRMAIDLIAEKLSAVDEPKQTCLTLRAFNRLRASILSVSSIDRRSFRPASRLKDLADRGQWAAIRSSCGIASLPKPGIFSPRTVRDLTCWAVIHAAKNVKSANEPWTRAEIRTVVRAVVSDVIGIDKFGDDDDFIYDMRVN